VTATATTDEWRCNIPDSLFGGTSARGSSRQPSGPRRSRSTDALLRQNWLLGLLALAALAGAITSDATSGPFWTRHALLAGLVASLVVVMLSLAVINEVLERRARRRWRILAQYVMYELVRTARMTWLGVLDVAGVIDAKSHDQASIDSAGEIVRDTVRLSKVVRDIFDDETRRSALHDEIAFLTDHSDQALGRWAGVMLNSTIYADVIDRHVELAGDIAWIGSLLDSSHQPLEAARLKRARSSPALQIEAVRDDDWVADRLVVITQLAETLDHGTLELALRLVPVQWWQNRLGTAE
jgi:hypothetical protein